jgi:5-methyltetrahydropteroyltriglutamate--homocysteine methyltransferase
MIINKMLPTTVVGSYPVVRGKGLRSLMDPLHFAVETAVSDQIEAGIDIISNGQVRGDMISAITSALPGIKGQSVTGVVQPAPRPITVADTKYALSRFKKVKGILTGPTTIAHGLKIATPSYRNRSELILDLAQALAVEAKHLEDAGATILQVDEPILSTGAADLGTARQAVHTLLTVVRIPVCLHVCGNLEHVIDDLLRFKVDVFDIECAHNPVNLEVLSEKDLKGRLVGLGVVDSSDPAIERVEAIAQRIRAGIDAFGPENLLIDPDCGLRMLTRDAAFGKLKAMVQAANAVRKDL